MYVDEYVLKYVFPAGSAVAICWGAAQRADATGWRAALRRFGEREV